MWPHMLAVISSHESARHARQCRGFVGVLGLGATGVAGSLSSCAMSGLAPFVGRRVTGDTGDTGDSATGVVWRLATCAGGLTSRNEDAEPRGLTSAVLKQSAIDGLTAMGLNSRTGACASGLDSSARVGVTVIGLGIGLGTGEVAGIGSAGMGEGVRLGSRTWCVDSVGESGSG